jgi:hypothetical protein
MRIEGWVGLLLVLSACPKEEPRGAMHPIPHAPLTQTPPTPPPPPTLAPEAIPHAPSAPPEVSKSDPAARALAKDCRATPWELADAGLTMSPEDLADARDVADRYRCGDDSPSERPVEGNRCLKARESCRQLCRTGCTECGKKCPPQCQTCVAACAAADAGDCRLSCGVAAAQCQKTCFRTREPCYDQCLDSYDACIRKADDDRARDCSGCPAVLDCCSQKTGSDHSVSCPEECWKGKVPELCGQCDWFQQ